MAETKYSYPISAFIGLVSPYTVPSLESLTTEIGASDIVTALDHIDYYDDDCDICFVGALSAGDQTILDGLVAAHTGTPPALFKFHSSSKVIEGSVSVTEETTWQELGGTVTTVGAFISDASKAWGRVIGQVKVSGSGAQMKVIRESDGLPLSADQDLVDTSDAWMNISFWANQNQTLATDCFIIQGKLDGATSFEVRYFSMSLLEKIQ